MLKEEILHYLNLLSRSQRPRWECRQSGIHSQARAWEREKPIYGEITL